MYRKWQSVFSSTSIVRKCVGWRQVTWRAAVRSQAWFAMLVRKYVMRVAKSAHSSRWSTASVARKPAAIAQQNAGEWRQAHRPQHRGKCPAQSHINSISSNLMARVLREACCQKSQYAIAQSVYSGQAGISTALHESGAHRGRLSQQVPLSTSIAGMDYAHIAPVKRSGRFFSAPRS